MYSFLCLHSVNGSSEGDGENTELHVKQCFTLSLMVFLTHPPAVHTFTEDSIVRLLNTSGLGNGNIPLITLIGQGLAKAECRHNSLSLPSICS